MPLDALSVAVGALATTFALVVVPRAMGRADDGAARTAAQSAYECRACNEIFDDDDAAREHAVETHAAISERTWRDVMREVGS